jgi:hypothetical protein
MQRWFTPENGFTIELSGVMAAWELAPRAAQGLEYRSACVGEQRHLPGLPGTFLCSGASVGSTAETLVELGVFTFVANRN